jgi:hypothetical protein
MHSAHARKRLRKRSLSVPRTPPVVRVQWQANDTSDETQTASGPDQEPMWEELKPHHASGYRSTNHSEGLAWQALTKASSPTHAHALWLAIIYGYARCGPPPLDTQQQFPRHPDFLSNTRPPMRANSTVLLPFLPSGNALDHSRAGAATAGCAGVNIALSSML